MKPARERFSLSNQTGVAEEDHEGRLESVFGFMLVAQYRPANAQYHRAVPLDEGRECHFGRFAATGVEQGEQLPVGQPPNRPEHEEGPDMLRPGARFLPYQSISLPRVRIAPVV
jgi:hypothetical protein